MPEGGGQLPGQGGRVGQVGSSGLIGARFFKRFGDIWLGNNLNEGFILGLTTIQSMYSPLCK